MCTSAIQCDIEFDYRLTGYIKRIQYVKFNMLSHFLKQLTGGDKEHFSQLKIPTFENNFRT